MGCLAGNLNMGVRVSSNYSQECNNAVACKREMWKDLSIYYSQGPCDFITVPYQPPLRNSVGFLGVFLSYSTQKFCKVEHCPGFMRFQS